MKIVQRGSLGGVSRLTLGSGGIGQVWGPTDRDEATATVRLAWESGITLFDMAPLYGDGEAESVMGHAFDGRFPDGLRVTTKCMLGDTPAADVERRLRASLDESCRRMRCEYADVFILHGYIVADDLRDSSRGARLAQIGVPETRYFNTVVPAFERLKASGRIGAWGITAASTQPQNLAALRHPSAPGVVQSIANLLDSPGGMAITRQPAEPRAVIAEASRRGIGVMGIRAVAAGSLTSFIDRKVADRSPEMRDWNRAEGFRALAAKLGKSPAYLAHSYALSMQGIDTVVLGIKNRSELTECLAAEADGRMSQDVIAAIDAAAADPAR